jgi:Transposase DDE domain
MLAVVYRGIAIPIYWLVLNKKGNSNTKERIALMKRFVSRFGTAHILRVLADREFIGGDWLKWLQSQGIDFGIRVKKDALIPNAQGILVNAEQLFYFLKVGEQVFIDKPRRMTGVDVYLTALRLEDGELLIVATSKPCKDTLLAYARRWQIETLFATFKGRGFNFEQTHITNRLRIKRLIAVMVIAFCFAHRAGEWHHEQVKPINIKKHLRLAKSIFRNGLDLLRCAFVRNDDSYIENIIKIIFQNIENKTTSLCT